MTSSIAAYGAICRSFTKAAAAKALNARDASLLRASRGEVKVAEDSVADIINYSLKLRA
jgi:hypothetical protein